MINVLEIYIDKIVVGDELYVNGDNDNNNQQFDSCSHHFFTLPSFTVEHHRKNTVFLAFYL